MIRARIETIKGGGETKERRSKESEKKEQKEEKSTKERGRVKITPQVRESYLL